MTVRVPPSQRTQDASDTPFDNTGTDFVSDNVQEAIEENRQVANVTKIIQASQSGNITTTSSSYSSLNLDLTPPQGTYLAILSLESTSNVSGINNNIEFGVFVAGTIVPQSERVVGVTMSGVSLASITTSNASVTTCLITVDGTQLVQGGWRRQSGSTTHTASNRQLILVEIDA